MRQRLFPVRMALRDLRRGRKKFTFFVLCIAIGVAGLVGIRGLNVSLQTALLKEARSLQAADLKMTLNQPANAEGAAFLSTLTNRGIQMVKNTETPTMAVNPTNSDAVLVELKAVQQPGYPFYGTLELDPAGPLSADTVLVGRDLLDRLGLHVGDAVKLGIAPFTISGVITNEPDKVTAGFGLGPRVMVTQEGLDRSQLMQVGSRARYSYLFKLASDAQVEQLRSDLSAAFANQQPRVTDFREAQPQIKRFLDRITAFLSLVSLVALLVGGLGVANATRVFVQQKLDAIAIMKCVGATNRKVVATFLTQILLLSVIGSAMGVVLGLGIQFLLPQIVMRFLPNLHVDLVFSPGVAVQGVLVGLATAILFTLLPLTAIAQVKPALVFRRDVAPGRPSHPWRHRFVQGGLLAVIGAGLLLIAAWVSGSFIWGLYFVGGLVVAIGLLGSAAVAAIRIVRLIKLPRRYTTARQGLANLHRPGSQTSAVVMALGVGVTVVLAVFLLQRSLMHEVKRTAPPGTPDMFFSGVKGSDAQAFKEFLKTNPGVESAPDPLPTVRGRLVRINGQTQEQLTLGQEEQRYFATQFQLTYNATLPPGNDVVQGRWWQSADYQRKALVSVEQSLADRLHLAVGSTIEMDLEGGHAVQAEVLNIRKTTDFRAGGNFSFVLAPGALDGVPVTYLGQARVKPGSGSAVLKEAVRQFPGVTVIDLKEVLEQVATVLNQIGLVIQFVAGFSVAAGLVILASSIAATKFRRTREAVLFKTLGATRSKVWRIFATEYAVLGLVAGVVGAVLAAGAAWAVLKYVMEVQYRVELLPLLSGVGVTVLLTVVVGVLSTVDVLAAKPLQVLRDE